MIKYLFLQSVLIVSLYSLSYKASAATESSCKHGDTNFVVFNVLHSNQYWFKVMGDTAEKYAKEAGYVVKTLNDKEATFTEWANFMNCSRIKFMISFQHGGETHDEGIDFLKFPSGILPHTKLKSFISPRSQDLVYISFSCGTYDTPFTDLFVNYVKVQKFIGAKENLMCSKETTPDVDFMGCLYVGLLEQNRRVSETVQLCSEQSNNYKFGVAGYGPDIIRTPALKSALRATRSNEL